MVAHTEKYFFDFYYGTRMNKPSKDVTAAELAILEKLWEHGPASIKSLAEWLYGASTPSDIATVQKLLSRLEAKDCVTRDRSGWPQLFNALLDRQTLVAQRVQATADELCDGTLSSLLTHLVKSKKFDARQRQRLRRMLDELDDK